MRIRSTRPPRPSPIRSLLSGILALAAGWGCSPAPATSVTSGDPASPRVADIAGDYRQLQSMTKEPVYVDPGLAMLCRGVTQSEVEEARKKSGPHAHTAVRIYMNQLAASAFQQRSSTYPVGSVVVKEKTALSYHSEGYEQTRTKAHDGVGGMIKRPRGFDAAHGDWEYFYFEDPSRIESGKISSCVQCHDGASTRDHVFGGWAGRG
jgi:hypothetical protein